MFHRFLSRLLRRSRPGLSAENRTAIEQLLGLSPLPPRNFMCINRACPRNGTTYPSTICNCPNCGKSRVALGFSSYDWAAIEELYGVTPTTNHPQPSCQTTRGADLNLEVIGTLKTQIFGLPADTKGQD